MTVLILAVMLLQCVFIFSGMFYLIIEAASEQPGEVYVIAEKNRTRERIGHGRLSGNGKKDRIRFFFFAMSRNNVELEFHGKGKCDIRSIGFLHRDMFVKYIKLKNFLLRDSPEPAIHAINLVEGQPAVFSLGAQKYSLRMNVPGIFSLVFLLFCLLLRFYDWFSKLICSGCQQIGKKKWFVKFYSWGRIQEVIFFLTVLPVIFLDVHSRMEMTMIIVIVSVLEFSALFFSFFGVFEKLKSKQCRPDNGLIQFFFVAVIVNLCLMEICRLKYAGLFSDESEKFMLPYFLHNGYKLYDTVFCHHGPVTVMLTHIIYLFHPVNDIGVFRASGFIVLLLPSVLFIFTDIIPKRNIRIVAALLFPFSFLLNYFIYSLGKWPIPCSIVLYQLYGAVFIGCALILLYPLLFREEYSPKYLFWAGVMLAFSFFCAISFAFSICLIALMVFLFFICNFRQSMKKISSLMYLIYGGSAGTLLIVFYLFLFGSVRGFVDQHILFNLQIYSKYISMEKSVLSRYITLIRNFPEQAFKHNSFYFILLMVLILLSPFFFSERSRRLKQTILHFIFCILIVFTAVFSVRAFPFMFLPLNFSPHVILMIAGCVLLSELSLSGIWLVIAVCFWTLLVEKKPQCRIPGHKKIMTLQLKQKHLRSSSLVQALTDQKDPVLFYPLGFAEYIGEQRLPGKVAFPFLTSWVYEYGKDRLFAEIRESKPLIRFTYNDKAWCQKGPMIREFLDFMRSMGYKQILGTDYYILPGKCSKPEELAKYQLIPVFYTYPAERTILHPFREINRHNQYRGKLIYPESLKNRMATAVIFRLPTYSRPGSLLDGKMNIKFFDRKGRIMYEYSMDCSDIVDNQPYAFPFDRPCRPVSVCISSTSSPRKGFTVWLNPANQLNVSAAIDPVPLHRKMRRIPVRAAR